VSRWRRRPLPWALCLLVLLSAPAAAQATYSDAKLDAFVRAAITVEKLLDQWIPRIDNAASDAEADHLRAQATHALFTAVEQTDGITLDEYQAINDASRSDPDLTARIAKIYRARTSE